MAYAGPTVTDFQGVVSNLDSSDEFEALLLAVSDGQFARIEVPKKNTRFAAEALYRLVVSVGSAPSKVKIPPKSTSALLVELDMNLAAGDRLNAEQCLAVLEREWRLNVVNLRFIEVRILTAFKDWSKLVEESWFEEICYVPKPRFVSHALLEALWYARLAPLSDDADLLRDCYNGGTQSLCKELLVDAKRIGGIAVQRILELEGEIVNFDEESTARSVGINQQTHEETTGWENCFNLIREGRFENIVDVVRQVTRSQPVSSLETNEINRIAEELQEFAIEDEFQPILEKIAPEFVIWLKDDAEFPRVQLKSLYQSMFTIFALLNNKSSAALYTLLDIFDALLELQPSAIDYRQHVQDIAVYVPAESGTGIAYWLIELADRLTFHPTADGDARMSLLSAILSSLDRIKLSLTRPQKVAYNCVAKVVEWPLIEDSENDDNFADNAQVLSGKLIAIYTLSESAGAQASNILEEAFPGVSVKVNSDHVCTPKLKSLSREADIFVVVTLSAKHAATNCIQQHRSRDGLLEYAVGRGATSIVKAVEDAVNRL